MAGSRGIVAFLIIGATAAGVVVGTAVFVQTRNEPIATGRCVVTDGAATYSLTADRADNAALIAVRARAYGFEVEGSTIGIATAIHIALAFGGETLGAYIRHKANSVTVRAGSALALLAAAAWMASKAF